MNDALSLRIHRLNQAPLRADRSFVLYWMVAHRRLGWNFALDQAVHRARELDLLDYDFLHERNLLFGTPEYVCEKVQELRDELNLQHLQVWSNFPCMPHDQVMKSVKLFSEKVMPEFAS